MASGKRHRDSTVVDELELPVSKRHATTGGPLKGLQKVSTQSRTTNIHVRYMQSDVGSVKLTVASLALMPLYAFVWSLARILSYPCWLTLQVPLFGAYYPSAQKPESQAQQKRRQLSNDVRRAAPPRLPCPRPGSQSSASWEAPELIDNDAPAELVSSTGTAPLLALQQPATAAAQQSLPGWHDTAKQSTDSTLAAQGVSTAAPVASLTLPPFPSQNEQPGEPGSRAGWRLAAAPPGSGQAQDGQPATGQSALLPSKPPSVRGGDTQHAAMSSPALEHLSNTALPGNSQKTQLGSLAGANPAGAGMPAPAAQLPFQFNTASEATQQQPSLTFGQPAQQVSACFTPSLTITLFSNARWLGTPVACFMAMQVVPFSHKEYQHVS